MMDISKLYNYTHSVRLIGKNTKKLKSKKMRVKTVVNNEERHRYTKNRCND